MKLLKFLSTAFFVLNISSIIATTSPVQNEEHIDPSSPPPYITIIKAWRHGATNANKYALLSGGGNDDPQGYTQLNEEGRLQAKKLGEIVANSGRIDVVYTSPLDRAINTANAVVEALKQKGNTVEVRVSEQLREILHGPLLELTDANKRNAEGEARIRNALASDDQCNSDCPLLKDKYRFWKIHPQAAEVVPEEIVDVENYIRRGETRPETPYHLWQRINEEFIRIAKENLGGVVGVSSHGAIIGTLLDGLNENPKGKYLPPHYQAKEIKIGDEVIVPAAVKVENCALIIFKYDSRNGKLELYRPQEK